MSEYYSGLTPAELERLALVVEECAEVQQIAMKIMRHGYESYNPSDEKMTSNRILLENELGDLMMAADLLASRYDVDSKHVTRAMHRKFARAWDYLHHNFPRKSEIGHPDTPGDGELTPGATA